MGMVYLPTYGKCRYTLEIEEKKLLYGKGVAFFKPSFWASMLIFRGYNHTWILRVNKNILEHDFSASNPA